MSDDPFNAEEDIFGPFIPITELNGRRLLSIQSTSDPETYDETLRLEFEGGLSLTIFTDVADMSYLLAAIVNDDNSRD